MSKHSNVLIDEVRAARHQIAAQCDNDPDKITHYAEQLAASTFAKRERISVPTEVKEMTGIISLPAGKSDPDLVRDAILESYAKPLRDPCSH